MRVQVAIAKRDTVIVSNYINSTFTTHGSSTAPGLLVC